MKTRFFTLALAFAFVLPLLAQAEKVKAKARDLKRNIEAGQTNKPPVPNPPAPAK